MNKSNVITLMLSLLTLGLGIWIGQNWQASEDQTDLVAEKRKILYWVAPMDPTFRRDGPGKSPMGMDLEPVYADEQSDTVGQVKISPQMTQNLGVRTALVREGVLARAIQTVGYVGYNADSLTMLHTRADGWLEKLHVSSAGDHVAAGQVIFELFSPKLLSAQQEYLTALTSGNRSIIRAARSRLSSLGFTEQQIERLEKKRKIEQRVAHYAPSDMVVADLGTREGAFVTPATAVVTLADLSSVWIEAEAFESQAGWLKPGLQAMANVPAFPGEFWHGVVEYVYPALDPVTRTLKLRLRFDNPGERLKPNMFATVTLLAEPKTDTILVPREALIQSGQGERVVVAESEGTFRVVGVKSGLASRGEVEILEGLSAGQRVVTSGQFLIDSEANIQQGSARISQDPSMVVGRGSVVDINARKQLLTVSHEPIPTLGWPAMMMDFFVPDERQLSGLTKGQLIEFHLDVSPDGDYRIVDLQDASESDMEINKSSGRLTNEQELTK